ncbi:MAG: hypothetical protein HC868_13470 [Sphingomonadales bacterium]|nr:hypothetical protein [Sphingomonadales bacterium]
MDEVWAQYASKSHSCTLRPSPQHWNVADGDSMWTRQGKAEHACHHKKAIVFAKHAKHSTQVSSLLAHIDSQKLILAKWWAECPQEMSQSGTKFKATCIPHIANLPAEKFRTHTKAQLDSQKALAQGKTGSA